MSFYAVNWAIQQPLKDAKEKLLLIVLAHFLNNKTGKCCPSRDALMTMACIANKATLTAKLTALVEKGLIEIVHGVGISNQYRFPVDFGAEVGSELNQVQDCTRFSSEPTPGSVLNHEQGRNKEIKEREQVAIAPAQNEQIATDRTRNEKVSESVPAKPQKAPEEKPKTTKPKKAKAVTIPWIDFKAANSLTETIPEKWQGYASSKGVSLATAQIEYEKFDAYFLQSGKQWADWHATWRSWILRNMKDLTKATAPASVQDVVLDDELF